VFNVGPFEMLVLAAVALIVFGPDKLPQLAKDAARMLRTLRDLLAPGGRILVGFHPVDSPASSARAYPVEEFVAHVEAAGLQVQHRFGTYELAPPSEEYCVAVLSR